MAMRAERKSTRDLLSPSVPLDAPHPSAVLEVTVEEYDALIKRLEEPPNPNERLRRTMSLHPVPEEA